MHFLGGAGFALIYALAQYDSSLSALSVLALLPCILRRLDERQRKIGQAPLAVAGLMLTHKMFTGRTLEIAPGLGPLAASWLPLFLAIALFYMPEEVSHTRKMLLGLGVLLLSSGLLPGSGFAFVFLLFQYVIPIAIAITLCIDLFSQNLHWNGPRPALPSERR
jgi:hypothetical protein